MREWSKTDTSVLCTKGITNYLSELNLTEYKNYKHGTVYISTEK